MSKIDTNIFIWLQSKCNFSLKKYDSLIDSSKSITTAI